MPQSVQILCAGLILMCFFLRSTQAANSKDFLSEFSARGFGRSLAHCFGSNERLKCLEMQILNALDAAIQDNSTWHYSDFLLIEKNTPSEIKYVNMTYQPNWKEARSLSDTFASKLLQLAQTRSIRIQVPPPPADVLAHFGNGISDAVDEETQRLKDKVNEELKDAEEGRKKKEKDKHMAMMGGMAMMAMVAQMFLGKVILIASAAFVMAKIALILSVIGSLKKGGSGGSGGGTDHVIVTSGGGGGGGGHSHDSGWHRSLPHQADSEERPIQAPPVNVRPFGNKGVSDAFVSGVGSTDGGVGVAGGGSIMPRPIYYNYEINEDAEGDFLGGRAGFL